ncbi:unnamed protein product [Rotaria sp. Silwood2]|nr:unnamed protein product [Rotaria sp. Silwood2]CAF4525591.1 unnamed protein product [Rotaria sp. Silwood2]
MEQRIPLHLISENSNNHRNRSSNGEKRNKCVRYIVGCVTITSIFGLIILLLMLSITIIMIVINICYHDKYYCSIEHRLSLCFNC